ncbi:MAG: hypothetical protein K8R58_14605 [Bacteroidales bacterium]|nr:hypothetical protein [Bacteroidales bacterium]
MERNKYFLQTFTQSLQNNIRQYIDNRIRNIFNILTSFKYKPKQQIKTENEKLENYEKLLKIFSKQKFRNESNRVISLETKIKLIEPGNVLKRGYSITFNKGKAVRDIKALKKGDIVTTEIYNGKFDSKIESINKANGK